MLGGPQDPTDRGQVLDYVLAGNYAWASPKFPFDESAKRLENARAYDRCYYPAGVSLTNTRRSSPAARVSLSCGALPRLPWLSMAPTIPCCRSNMAAMLPPGSRAPN